MMNTYEKLIDRFVAYANNTGNILAAYIIGSRVRSDHPADKYSDLDIFMVVSNPEFFLTTNDWVKQIGDYHISFIEDTIAGEKERRVLFDGFLDVDFVLISESIAVEVLTGYHGLQIFKNGYTVLVDNSGLSQHIPKDFTALKEYVSLSEYEFINLVNNFWYHAVWAIKKILRGELWAAKFCVDSYMKGTLLRLIEYHALAKNGMEYNTWHNGRFIDTWADKKVICELPNAFSHYQKDDITRALIVTMDLFHAVAIEAAERLSYKYPIDVEQMTKDWIYEVLEHIQ